MTPDTQLSIALLISLASITFAAISFFSNRKKDIKNENEQFIRISIHLENIQKITMETKEDLRMLNDKLLGVIEEQIEQRQQIKEIWRAIRRLEENEKSNQ